jgi:photosystem II stability/assembly factor-like uncharacterized protein
MMKACWTARASLVAALLLVGGAAVHAQPSAWVSRGPGGGGALFAPTLSPHQSAEAFLSCDMGGLYRSSDWGASWSLLDFRQIRGSGQGCQVQFTSNPNILYAIDYSNDVAVPAKSTDGGSTWTQLAADPTYGGAYAIAADPSRTDRVLVCDYNTLYFSGDGGTTFAAKYSNGNGCYLAGAFFDGNTIYVGTSAGVLFSTNGGSTFALNTPAGIASGQAVVSFAGAKQNGITRFFCVTLGSGDVYPGVTGADHANYMSVYTLDWGGAWVSRTTGIASGDHPFFAGASRSDVSTAYLAGGSDAGVPVVYRTSDGGAHWAQVLLTTNNQNVYTGWSGAGGARSWGYGEYALGFAVSPVDPNRAIITDLGFAHVTSDGGASWHQAYVRPAYENPANTTIPLSKSYLSCGLENTTCWGLTWSDSSNAFASFTDIRGVRSTDGGTTWSFDYTGHTNNTMYRCVKHPTTGVLYAATSSVHDLYQSTYLTDSRIDGGGGLVLFSSDKGKTWQTLHNFGHVVCWVALDPTNATRLYACVAHSSAGGIYVSSNINLGASSTWARVAANPTRTQGHPYTLSVLSDGSLVAAYSGRRDSGGAFTDSSGVFISSNGGGSWTDRSDAGMHYWTKDLVVDSRDSTQSTWYVGVFSGWGGAPNGLGGLYKTADRGVHWSRILTLDRVESCTISPSSASEMYVTTEAEGLWMTSNLTALSPTFSPVAGYPFAHPIRVLYDPYQSGRVWVTSFGYGLCVGMGSSPRASEISSDPSSPLRIAKAGSLADVSFEDGGAARYNLYVSKSPSGHPFKVLNAASGKRSCALSGLLSSGGRLTLQSADLSSGITGSTNVLYVLVSADNGPGTEGPLGRDGLGESLSADTACGDQ